MVRLVGIVLLMVVSGSLWAAENATFREVKGKVEYQIPGNDWMPAKVGVAIPAGATISTGFRSSAALELLGSIILVRPLTRMVLDELTKTTQGTKTGLTLLSGKVRAEVKPSSTTSKTDFEVKSPTATASVLGTGFEFDGENLLVGHGSVHFVNRYNVSRAVDAGEFSSAAGHTVAPSPPVAVMAPEKPLLTANGGANEVDAALGDTTSGGGSLTKSDVKQNLTQITASYGNTIVITPKESPTQATLQQVQSVLNNSKTQVAPQATANITVTVQ